MFWLLCKALSYLSRTASFSCSLLRAAYFSSLLRISSRLSSSCLRTDYCVTVSVCAKGCFCAFLRSRSYAKA